MSVAPAPTLRVAGDVALDHHLYAGTRHSPGEPGTTGTLALAEAGGAALLHRLLAATLGETVALHPLSMPADNAVHAHAVWAPFPGPGESVWRVRQSLGFGGEAGTTSPAPHALTPADLLVLDDGGHRFRHDTHRALWPLPAPDAAPPRWILLKQSAPLAQGALWHALLTSHADRLVCVVAAEDFRAGGAGISRGLSWEATVEGLRAALLLHPGFAPLAKARHLVVTSGLDGALWLDRAAGKGTLCFDAGGAEGEFAARIAGGVFGARTAFAAALAQRLAAHCAGPSEAPLDLAPALESGLRAMRDLLLHGHGPADPATPPQGYPVEPLAAVLRAGQGGFARAEISWAEDPAPGWMLLEAAQRPAGTAPPAPLLGLAMQVVRRGPAVLERLPHARFGALTTADRSEIETLRHLRRLMRDYAAEPRPKRPLSLGVFGPPGAGKSFGVKQLAKEVFGAEGWLEFNLSQFEGQDELHGAFHQIRDQVLAGRTPVAFWDEFDSQGLRWLQYLLAPMQDGTFQAGQLTHAVGRCVFVFAGGTMPSFRAFAGRADDADFVARKGPDFVSRLDAHLDVLGPNPRLLEDGVPDPSDLGVPLRRALLLRGQLGLDRAARLEVDTGLLRALLGVPRYTHGSRSLEKLVMGLCRAGGGTALRRSALPAPAQLGMLVPLEEFVTLMDPRGDALEGLESAAVVEVMAAAIHETWRDLARAEGWSMQARFDKAYADLAEVDKEDNRAAARRVPVILALVGLSLCRGEGLAKEAVSAQLERNLERLAEEEHDGWMAHRAAHGWRFAETRDDDALLHPAMLPYAELPEREKGKDRNAVLHFPDFAAKAGFGIGWLG